MWLIEPQRVGVVEHHLHLICMSEFSSPLSPPPPVLQSTPKPHLALNFSWAQVAQER